MFGTRRGKIALVGCALLALVGCRKSNMQEQPKFSPYKPDAFFSDDESERPLVPGTVVHGQPRTDELLYHGTVGGKVVDQFPFPITHADLERGQQQFNIYCSVCHGQAGAGDGMIVRRGFSPPPSYHTDRLRQAPVGHFFQVITSGWGAMYGYAERVQTEDRWRIAAYIRALQLSQDATADQLTDDQRRAADAAPVVSPNTLDGYPGPLGKNGAAQ